MKQAHMSAARTTCRSGWIAMGTPLHSEHHFVQKVHHLQYIALLPIQVSPIGVPELLHKMHRFLSTTVVGASGSSERAPSGVGSPGGCSGRRGSAEPPPRRAPRGSRRAPAPSPPPGPSGSGAPPLPCTRPLASAWDWGRRLHDDGGARPSALRRRAPPTRGCRRG